MALKELDDLFSTQMQPLKNYADSSNARQPQTDSNSSNIGLSAYPMEQARMFNQDALYAPVMDNLPPATPAPSTFTDSPTNTSVLNGNIFVDDISVDGKMHSPYTGITGTMADRHINPGNISGVSGNLLYGASRIARNKASSKRGNGDVKQLVFPDARTGWRAMYSLMNKPMYNNAPIVQAFSKYQENKDAWKTMVSGLNKKGIDTNMVFKNLTMEQKVLFMQERARHEGWTGVPLTREMLR